MNKCPECSSFIRLSVSDDLSVVDVSCVCGWKITAAHCPDPNVMAVVDSHVKRAKAGYEKYGVDTTRGDLSEIDWLNHLREELMDAAIYAQRIIEDRKMGEIDQSTINAFLRRGGEYDSHESLLASFSRFVRDCEVRVGLDHEIKPITVGGLMEQLEDVCKRIRNVGVGSILKKNEESHNFRGKVDNNLVDAVMCLLLNEFARDQGRDWGMRPKYLEESLDE